MTLILIVHDTQDDVEIGLPGGVVLVLLSQVLTLSRLLVVDDRLMVLLLPIRRGVENDGMIMLAIDEIVVAVDRLGCGQGPEAAGGDDDVVVVIMDGDGDK